MQFIEILKTIVLGIIQGITEWLPISSTGHMILADTFLQLNQPKDFMDMFFVVIQLGSILAVVVLYFNKLNPFAPSKSRAERYSTFQLWAKVLVAVLPVGVIGLLVDDWVTEHFYPCRHRHRPHLLRHPVHPAGTPQPHCKAAHPLL